MCPLLFEGLKWTAAPLIANKILDLRESNEIEVNFDGKNQRKIMIFGNFEMSSRCHGNRKFKTEHVVTNAMVQLTSLPSLICIEEVFIVQ
jgi:hypothetical protein